MNSTGKILNSKGKNLRKDFVNYLTKIYFQYMYKKSRDFKLCDFFLIYFDLNFSALKFYKQNKTKSNS